jgi:hypothetical protein
MLSVHEAAISSRIASYHEFLSRYSKRSKVVYGFVEGKEDPCFYRGFIEQLLPDDWNAELWPAGNKDKVYQIHTDLDWRRFPKKRICFFVDRDLSDIIPEKIARDSNIYITDGYSIENDIVKKGTCKRVLSEICGYANVNHHELENVCVLFEREFTTFLKLMIPIMAWILAWKRSGKRPNLNDIRMKDLFCIQNGCIKAIETPKRNTSIIKYLHDQGNVIIDPSIDVSQFENEFRSQGHYKKITRGKYVFWFLVEFCNSVHRDTTTLFRSLSKPPKKNITLSDSNGITVIGPRARVPMSLRKFLKETFCAHIDQFGAKAA